ncbi:MAG: hypothetical protein RI884_2173 [Pseudomonadota bacterium]|jgi:5-methylcytosine-specific restriction endonuclease McrA
MVMVTQLHYSWRDLNRALSELTEPQVKELLDQELSSLRRVTILERLHQRYNTLRIARERAELFADADKKSDLQRPSQEASEMINEIFPDEELEKNNGPAGLPGNIPAAGESVSVTLAIPDLEKRNEEAVFDALNRFEKKCPYCGKEQYRVGIRDKIEIDHFVPISKGGQNVPWNLLPVCKACNRKKRDRLPIDFLPPEVFEVISAYLSDVKKAFQLEGYDSYFTSAKVIDLIRSQEAFIKANSGSDFIKQLVHLVCFEEAGSLLAPPTLPDKSDSAIDTSDESVEESDEELIKRLSDMSFIDYHRSRSASAKRLMVRVNILDDLVAAARAESIYLEQYGEILELVKQRRGIFSIGVVGAPFENICKILSAGRESPVGTKALLEILIECGWADMGRIKSRDYDNKRHVFCAPELFSLSKSEIRRLLERNQRLFESGHP